MTRINVEYVPSEYKAVWIFPQTAKHTFSCIQVWDWK